MYEPDTVRDEKDGGKKHNPWVNRNGFPPIRCVKPQLRSTQKMSVLLFLQLSVGDVYALQLMFNSSPFMAFYVVQG